MLQGPPVDAVFQQLTAAQREAVEHVDGPLLIVAGPGSGKTRVVTHRVAHLIRCGVAPQQIVALTFTNKAADQMRRRLRSLTPVASVWMGTFHAFCARLLRRYAPLVGLTPNFTIYDEDDSRRVMQRVQESLDWVGTTATTDQLRAVISRAKNHLTTPDRFTPRCGWPGDHLAAELYPRYQQRLLASSAVDFDDLLLHVATMLAENPDLRSVLDERYRYILVDEYQDTNRAQYAILRSLSHDHPHLAVTGDPDQSIYSWRGANLGNILEFTKDFPGTRVVRLEQNWRSTQRILNAADRLIAFNQRRLEKTIVTDNPPGQPVQLSIHASETDEAEHIATRIEDWIGSGTRRASDIAIFYRTNALSRNLEAALQNHGIPYQLVHGLAFYQRKEVRDVLAYATLIHNPRDDVALLRIINTPPRRLGKTTVRRLMDAAGARGMTLLEGARCADTLEGVSKAAAARLKQFAALIEKISSQSGNTVRAALEAAIDGSGYREMLAATATQPDIDRQANVDELLSDAAQFDAQQQEPGQLEAFLERVRLASDTDDWDQAGDRVTLMTLHAAKGLEFPVVFIVAVEEGLLPHERNRTDPEFLEEERRLLFVGMTRAEQWLELTLSIQRSLRGVPRRSIPSSFLMELPREEMEITGLPSEAALLPGVERPKPRRPRRSPVSRQVTLTTAAKLAGQGPPPAAGVAARDIERGMIVVHPDYGPGKVVALDGSGPRRAATVAFAAAGHQTIVLSDNRLQPVGSGRDTLDEGTTH